MAAIASISTAWSSVMIRAIMSTGLAALAQFARLIRQIGVPDGDRIAASTTDWIDTDSNIGANGAEDDTYSSRTPAYRTANTLMTDPSELPRRRRK